MELNDIVWATLTQEGAKFINEDTVSSYPKMEEGQIIEIELWELIYLFGSKAHIGTNITFTNLVKKPNIIIL